MLERLDEDQIATTSEVPTRAETGQDYPLVESLVRQLGVPAERVETILRGLCVALGQKNNPVDIDDMRVVKYLKFKITRNGK